MTVLEVIQRSGDYLARKGVESPRLQIELLLAQVLQMPRLKLYLNFERVLTEPELATLRAGVRRRGEREPLQHILGTASFCGLEIEVNSQVLIPRPETEILAEKAWQFLQTRPVDAQTALDFGTGSGCLAVALAVKCPSARIHALDKSSEALAVARRNALRNGVDGRIDFRESDGLSALPRELQFDLLVSNPPYIPTAEIAGLQPEVKDHDPRLALDGGADGLEVYRRLVVEALPFLRPGSPLMTELGDGQAEAVAEIVRLAGWRVESVCPDYSGRPRILIALR